MTMIRLVNNNESRFEIPYDIGGSEEDIVLVAESISAPYKLYAVPRWNSNTNMSEPHYEILNSMTGVTEQRVRVSMIAALGMLEAFSHMYEQYKEAGSVSDMSLSEEDYGEVENVH